MHRKITRQSRWNLRRASDRAIPNQAPGMVGEGVETGWRASLGDEGTVRLSSKGESDRITQRSAVQIRPRNHERHCRNAVAFACSLKLPFPKSPPSNTASCWRDAAFYLFFAARLADLFAADFFARSSPFDWMACAVTIARISPGKRWSISEQREVIRPDLVRRLSSLTKLFYPQHGSRDHEYFFEVRPLNRMHVREILRS
jgi:hypothetical protein